jgi:hypothetical protein
MTGHPPLAGRVPDVLVPVVHLEIATDRLPRRPLRMRIPAASPGAL